MLFQFIIFNLFVLIWAHGDHGGEGYSSVYNNNSQTMPQPPFSLQGFPNSLPNFNSYNQPNVNSIQPISTCQVTETQPIFQTIPILQTVPVLTTIQVPLFQAMTSTELVTSTLFNTLDVTSTLFDTSMISVTETDTSVIPVSSTITIPSTTIISNTIPVMISQTIQMTETICPSILPTFSNVPNGPITPEGVPVTGSPGYSPYMASVPTPISPAGSTIPFSYGSFPTPPIGQASFMPTAPIDQSGFLPTLSPAMGFQNPQQTMTLPPLSGMN